MKKYIIFKITLSLFSLLSGFNLCAQNVSIITIHISNGSSLSDLLGDRWKEIENLTITGSIGYNDLPLLRSMSGAKLTTLNMEDASLYLDALPENSFSAGKTLEKIILPKNIISIGKNSFLECENIKSIILQNGIIKIDDNAFFNCKELSQINIPNGVKEIGSGAFENCYKLSNIDLPNSIEVLTGSVFNNCTSLTSISIPENVNILPLLQGCTMLSSVYITKNVRQISEFTFYKSNKLESINVAESNPNFTSIEGVLFSKDEKTLIKYPNFKGNTYKIPIGVINIENSAFLSCENLESIVISNTVCKIGRSSFGLCKGLVSIIFPNAISEIGDDLFDGCTNMKELYTESITPIKATYKTFRSITSFCKLYVPKGAYNSYWISEGWRDFKNIIEEGIKIPISKITLDKSSLSLFENKSEILTLNIEPSNATNKSIVWKSNNDAIATVDQAGIITGVKEGTTTITASSIDGKITASCTVIVKKEATPITMISLNKVMLALKEGDTEVLIVTVSPTNATNKNVVWTSDNELVATISADGEVTAIKLGIANITVKSEDNKFAASCEVTVTNNPTSNENLPSDRIKILSGNSSLTIECDTEWRISIYSITGVLICKKDIQGIQQIDLPKGIYVVSTDGYSKKVIVK